MSIYREWGLEPIINACGSVTRLGGAPMPREVVDAFAQASLESVPLDALHGRACDELVKLTGAEAGLVTAGAAASLMLGSAAILARYDLRRIEKLPDADDFPCEFVMAREHRNGYDHAVRAAGARLVEVGMNEIVSGAGVRRTEPWEYETAFGPKTAGVLYVYDPHARPPLADVVKVAHSWGFPVLVDAAGELPPRDNLRAILATGSDLVCFSGGKSIRGPQATGLLLGRKEFVGSAALQMLDLDDHFELWTPPANLIDKSKLNGLPRHGVGRALKVSKEQIIAQLVALRLFASGAYDAELPAKRRMLDAIAASLREAPVRCNVRTPADGQGMPLLEIAIDEKTLGRSAFDACRSLRHGSPPVYVGHGSLFDGKLVINPLHLNDERCGQLIGRLVQELKRP